MIAAIGYTAYRKNKWNIEVWDECAPTFLCATNQRKYDRENYLINGIIN